MGGSSEICGIQMYVYNRTPRKEFNGKTPYQKFFGRKHHEVKLHKWGCLMYVHVETRSKKDLINLKHLEQEQLDIKEELRKQQQTDKDKQDLLERQHFSNSLPVMDMKQGTLKYI